MSRFTIRDVLWLTVVVVVGIVAYFSGRIVEASNDIWRLRAGTLEHIVWSQGWQVRWTDESVDVRTARNIYQNKTYRLKPTNAPSPVVAKGDLPTGP